MPFPRCATSRSTTSTSSTSGRVYLTGAQALVRLPMLQRQRDALAGLNTGGFISGYRGSPLGALDQALWKAQKFLDARQHHVPAGPERGPRGDRRSGARSRSTCFAGAKVRRRVRACGTARARASTAAATCSSTPTSRAPSKHGGVLVLAGDDHAAKSSTLPHQSRAPFCRGDDAGALSVVGAGDPRPRPARLGDVALLRLLGRLQVRRRHGRELGRRSTSTRARTQIVVPDDFPLPPDGVSIRWPDAFLATEARMQDYKIYAALHYCARQPARTASSSTRRSRGSASRRRGKSYLDVRQALDDLGIDRRATPPRSGIRLYKIGDALAARARGRARSSPKASTRSSSSRRSASSSSTS